MLYWLFGVKLAFFKNNQISHMRLSSETQEVKKISGLEPCNFLIYYDSMFLVIQGANTG